MLAIGSWMLFQELRTKRAARLCWLAAIHFKLEILALIVFNNNHGRSLPTLWVFLLFWILPSCSKIYAKRFNDHDIMCVAVYKAIANSSLTPPSRHQHLRCFHYYKVSIITCTCMYHLYYRSIWAVSCFGGPDWKWNHINERVHWSP